MGRDFTLYPGAYTPTFMAVALFLVAMLVFAVGLEVYRQRRERRRWIAEQWNAVRKIAQEKDMLPAEWALLEQILRESNARGPLETITVREVFGRCTRKALERVRQKPEEFERYAALLWDIRTRLGLDYVPYARPIEGTRDLAPGQDVTITAGTPKTTVAMKVAALNEAYLFVTPKEGEGLPRVEPGALVDVVFFRTDDARYRCQMRLKRVDPNPFRWVLEHSDSLVRTQERQFYRVRCHEAADIAVVAGRSAANGSSEVPLHSVHRATLINVSAGGFGALLTEPVPIAAPLRVTLRLTGTPPLTNLPAKTISCMPLPHGRYVLRAMFTDVEDDDREKIVHYVFREQQRIAAQEAEQRA